MLRDVIAILFLWVERVQKSIGPIRCYIELSLLVVVECCVPGIADIS